MNSAATSSPWAAIITGITTASTDITDQFSPKVKLGPASASALTVEDLLIAIDAHMEKRPYTEDSLRGGSFLADRFHELNRELIFLEGDLVDALTRGRWETPDCITEKHQLEQQTTLLKDARLKFRVFTSGNGDVGSASMPSAWSAGERALGALMLSRKSLTFFDVKLASSAASTGEYDPWYAGTRMLMQATVQVQYKVYPSWKQSNRPGLLAVICQSVGSVKDARFYVSGFSANKTPSAGRSTNCAVVTTAPPRSMSFQRPSIGRGAD